VGWLGRFRRSASGGPAELHRTLLVLTAERPELPDGSIVLEEDLELELVGVTDYEGRPALPAFTSEATLLEWQPEGSPYVALPVEVVMQLLLEGDWERIVVDTGSDDGYEITRDEAAALSGC
jgi:hypothetical protein